MHSGDLGTLSEAGLTEAEKNTLLQVMQRAKEFDQTTALKLAQENTPLEGTLLKWTNVVKGWQPRWVRLDQQQSVLHYYASEDRKKQAPRGSLHLWGAVVAPSDEDAHTFTVSSASGEEYKLRAADAKEKQHWVARLRKEIDNATNIVKGTKESPRLPSVQMDSAAKIPKTEQVPAAKTPVMVTSSEHSKSPPPSAPPPRPAPYSAPRPPKSPTQTPAQHSKSPDHQKHNMESIAIDFGEGEALPGGDAMLELFTRLYCGKESLVLQLESCGPCGLDPFEKNVLLLKATSHAAVASVKDCLACLKASQNELFLEGSYEHLNKDMVNCSTMQPPSSTSDLTHKHRKRHKTSAAF